MSLDITKMEMRRSAWGLAEAYRPSLLGEGRDEEEGLWGEYRSYIYV